MFLGTSPLTSVETTPGVLVYPSQVGQAPVDRSAKPSPVARLMKWRAENPGVFEARRIEGLKKSSLVRENLLRLHRERKAEWFASAMKNPKLRATDQHIAAKEWRVKSPTGAIFEFRNLKKFVRENEQLFDTEDVQWKLQNGKANQAWCRAFQMLARLRPGNSKLIDQWNGWSWAGQ